IENHGGGGTITGVVVDASGAAVSNPSISVRGSGPNDFVWARPDSDEHGAFTIRDLRAHTYVIAASSTTLGAPAQTVKLEAGGHLELRFVVTEPAAISGIVVDDLGLPAVGVLVTGPDPQDASATSDLAGHFQLSGLTKPSYDLETWRYLDLEERATHVTAHPGDHDIRVVSPRPGAVTLRVVMNGQPVDYYGVTLTDELTKQ